MKKSIKFKQENISNFSKGKNRFLPQINEDEAQLNIRAPKNKNKNQSKQSFPLKNLNNQTISDLKPSFLMKKPTKFPLKPKETNEKSRFSRLNYHIIKIICEYAIEDINDLFNFTYLNKFFQNLIYNFHPELWTRLYYRLKKTVEIYKEPNLKDLNSLREIVIECSKQNLINFYQGFDKKIQECFKPQANSQNIPNKLLKKMNFQLEFQLIYNKKIIKNTKKLNINGENFISNYLCDLKEINTFEFGDLYCHKKIEVHLSFGSTFLKKKINIDLEIPLSSLFQTNHKNSKSVFLYYYEFPCFFYYFPDDKRFINCFLSISGSYLLQRIHDSLQKYTEKILYPQKSNLKKWNIHMKNINAPLIPIRNFIERFKQETDFEFYLRFHDRKTTFFSYFNTKAFPIELNKNEIIFLFEIKEEIQKEISLKMTDGLGISENLVNFCFCDFVLKDSIDFIEIFNSLITFEEVKMESQGKENNFDVQWDLENSQIFKSQLNNKSLDFYVVLKKTNDHKGKCKTVIESVELIKKNII